MYIEASHHTHTHTAGKQYYEGSTSCVDAYIYRSLYLLHDDTRFSRTGRRRRRINVTSFFLPLHFISSGVFLDKRVVLMRNKS